MTDRLDLGSPEIEPKQTLRARAALAAAGAWDATPTAINVQGYNRIVILADYEQGAAGGSCDLGIEWAPHQTVNVPAGGPTWYPLTTMESQVLTAGVESVAEVQQAVIRFDPSAAGQNTFVIDLSLPSNIERVRVAAREVGVVGTPGTLGLFALLSPLEGGMPLTLSRARANGVQTEDTAHVSGDEGVMTLAVRQDALAVLAANGDYIPLVVDSTGRLYVNSNGLYAEDAAHTSADLGRMALAVRQDAAAALAANGDYIPLIVDANGRLWVSATITAMAPATPPAAVYHGKKTVAVPGTEEPLAAAQALVAGWAHIKAEIDNAGYVYVGVNGVSAADGFLLVAGDEVVVYVANLNTIYLDVSVAGDGAYYIAS